VGNELAACECGPSSKAFVEADVDGRLRGHDGTVGRRQN
jgi:hypothetical protein